MSSRFRTWMERPPGPIERMIMLASMDHVTRLLRRVLRRTRLGPEAHRLSVDISRIRVSERIRRQQRDQ